MMKGHALKNFANTLSGLSEPARLTYSPRAMRSGADWLASATPQEVDGFLGGLSDNALAALPWMFEFWALPHQLPPDGGWKTWIIMGGRGAGKTRAGAEWVRSEVEGPRPLDPGRAKRVALVGETVLIIHSQANRDTRPHLIGGHGDHVWATGKFRTLRRWTSRPGISREAAPAPRSTPSCARTSAMSRPVRWCRPTAGAPPRSGS